MPDSRVVINGGGAALSRTPAVAKAALGGAGYAVGPQYDSTHAYVRPNDLDAFVRSVIATLGGTAGDCYSGQVTPTLSRAIVRPIWTPAGNIAAFAFTTSIPFPFGRERTGYLVSDLDRAIASAQTHGADVVVKSFPDAVGRDVIIQWPGGIYMQLYCHTIAPTYPALRSLPENRFYVSEHTADAFVRGFLGWSNGEIVSDNKTAPGVEIGCPETTFRRVRISSGFGRATVLVTDGPLPGPFGREISGFEVPDLDDALNKAAAEGVEVLVAPFHSQDRSAAFVKFPGGFIAELHNPGSLQPAGYPFPSPSQGDLP